MSGSMDYSLFYILHRPEGITDSQAFGELIDQCVAADELGYKAVWFAEHHFSRVGMVPDPLLLCAAVAQRTRRIRLGTAISIMPFHNPIRLAEQAAMVDVLSGGRLDLGIGRGSQPKEFMGFGVRPSESRERLKEGVEIVSRLLSGEKLTFRGKYFSCDDVEVFPHPIQKPRPPIWLAGTSPETYAYAGERGYLVMASAGFTGPEVYRSKMDLFREAVRARGGETGGLPRCLVHHLHVCGNGEAEAVFGEVEAGEGWYLRHRGEVNEVDLPEEEGRHLKRNWSYELNLREIISGGGVIGPPEDVAADIRRLRDAYGVNHVLVAPWRGPGHASVMKSLERFAREVMPAV